LVKEAIAGEELSSPIIVHRSLTEFWLISSNISGSPKQVARKFTICPLQLKAGQLEEKDKIESVYYLMRSSCVF
jgi:hypothetical protein